MAVRSICRHLVGRGMSYALVGLLDLEAYEGEPDSQGHIDLGHDRDNLFKW